MGGANDKSILSFLWKESGTSLSPDPHRTLKMLIWTYFYLWIFEGALRKWFLPGLSTPLLLIRDPVVLWLIYLANARGLLKFNIYLTGMAILGVISLFTAVFLGHGNIFVAIYGARTLLLYFPLIFIIGRVFNQEDVINIGRMVLFISVPMTILLGLQFYSPQSAWVNRGVGGDEAGSGFGGVFGYFRPSATFSFVNGTAYFYSLVAPYLIYFWLNPKLISQKLLIAASCALIIAIPLSICRGLFFQVAVSIVFLFMAVSRKPKYLGKLLIAGFIFVFAMVLLGNVEFFNTSTEVFMARFEGANEEEGGLTEGVLGDRFLGRLIKSITGSADQSATGFGIGSGTAFGANMLQDDRIILMADFEWMRQIGEFGLLGLLVVCFRVGLTVRLSLASYVNLVRNDMLPWLMMSLGALTISQGPWYTPTALGFCSMIGGLWIASLKSPYRKN